MLVLHDLARAADGLDPGRLLPSCPPSKARVWIPIRSPASTSPTISRYRGSKMWSGSTVPGKHDSSRGKIGSLTAGVRAWTRASAPDTGGLVAPPVPGAHLPSQLLDVLHHQVDLGCREAPLESRHGALRIALGDQRAHLLERASVAERVVE
jgi:hypothetical protein